jgi:glycosyltransferase involved in cell wall biosynthesis
VPIVAHDSGAITETLGRGGILLRSRDAIAVAEALDRIHSNPTVRKNILNAQIQERLRFNSEIFEAGFSKLLISA